MMIRLKKFINSPAGAFIKESLAGKLWVAICLTIYLSDFSFIIKWSFQHLCLHGALPSPL